MTTLHALQRTNERTGFNLKTSERFISNAIQRGKGAENFIDRERHYLLQAAEDSKKALVYNSYCFIISADNICITMFPVPKWFGKKMQYSCKNKIKRTRNYQRHKDFYQMEENDYGFCKVS